MQVLVTGRHLDLTNEIRAYAREKAARLPRYYDRIKSIEIVVGQDGGAYAVEMTVLADHRQQFVGQEANQDLFAAVDLLMDKMKRQLTRHKERFRNRKHPPTQEGIPPEIE